MKAPPVVEVRLHVKLCLPKALGAPLMRARQDLVDPAPVFSLHGERLVRRLAGVVELPRRFARHGHAQDIQHAPVVVHVDNALGQVHEWKDGCHRTLASEKVRMMAVPVSAADSMLMLPA